MNLLTSKINFKGYDASPLRRITVSDIFAQPLLKELKTIGEKENIEILSTPWGPQWYQDSEVVLDGGKNKKPHLLINKTNEITRWHYQERTDTKNYSIEVSSHYIKGGDCYIGKCPNGEKWMLLGEEEEYKKDLDNISKKYNIKPQNIHFIPKKNYHLDTYIRPIGYPYVLVDDEEMVLKLFDEMNSKKKYKKSDIKDFRKSIIDFEQKRKEKYCSTDDVCKKLSELGFVPIKVAGVWGKSINFMNAIVNQHPDGTISYITGSSKCKNKFMSDVQEVFEQELKRKIPNLKSIYFIQGEKDNKNVGYGNKIMQTLEKYKGGLHCMTLEEPDFDIWA